MSNDLTQNKFLDDAERQLLERKIKTFMDRDHDRYLPVLVAMRTGARRSEVQLLKASSINWASKTITIMPTKKSKSRELPLDEPTLEALKSYIQRAHLESGDLLFDLNHSHFNRIWKEIKPCKKSFHSLRHTFAINVFRKTKDIQKVMKALGHRSILSTMVYADYAYTTEEMKDIIFW